MKQILSDINFKIIEKEKDNNGIKYQVTINVPMTIGWIERMKFIVETSSERTAFQLKHIKNENNYVCFKGDVYLPTKALYHYYFSFEANHNFIYYKKNLENINTISRNEMWKMSVNFEVPDWAKGKMMYHIFIDRFNKHDNSLLKEMPNRTIHSSWDEDIIIGEDANGRWNADFYGGNIEGIIDKLSYIKSLGVSIIYLSPICWSQSNHRYDTADYEQVDPYIGTNTDLKKLCTKAHEMGMKIILDAVFNHTGNDSKYFNEYHSWQEKGAYESMDSKYFPFYRKYIQNNQVFFDYWWGMKNLPVCDGSSPSWQQYIYGVGGIIDLWYSLGIDGLRLDVADELSDEFIEGIRSAVKRNKKDGFILGEVWKNPMRMKRGYLESGKGMDSVMNYQLVNALIRYFKYSDTVTLRSVLYEILEEYPNDTINSLMNFTSTHDITRAINIFSSNEFQINGEWSWNLNNDDRSWQKNYELTKEQYLEGKKIYQAYLYTLAFLPGIFSIFYGDEIGMQGMGNLANRRPFTWNMIDYKLLEYFKMIGKIRNNEKFLETASLNPLIINDNYFAFEREDKNIKAQIYVNRTDKNIKLDIHDYDNKDILYPLNNSNINELTPYGGIVLKKVKK